MSRGQWSDEDFATLPSLSVAAHELKAPLALVRQLALLLDDRTLSDTERASYHGQLVATSERALNLTMDLTQAANLQPSLFPLEPVNPFAICQAMARELRPMSKIYGRDIAWPKNRRGVLMVANRQLLTRITANFIDNAIKYTEANVPIAVSVQQRQGSVRLSVRDFGPRLTRAEYRRLTDEMEQMKTVKTRPESSGLGVFLAAKFAQAMQGKIGLTRHSDGVTFFVELPASGQMSLL